MRGRGAAWVLALVLLAGCAPAPAAEPPEEPEVRVRTHWEALETRAGSLPDVETPWPGGIGEFPIVKDTTPNMMNPRLYTTSYNKPQGQQFDDTAVLSFIKLQYT